MLLRLDTAQELEEAVFCLRNADGSEFNPTTAAQVKSFLLRATATNMANMLSAQLIAMSLNVAHGFVNGNALVLAGSNPGGCSVPVNLNGFITVNALLADAAAELCAHSVVLSGNPERVCQEFKKNALDKANNNLNFVRVPVFAPSRLCSLTRTRARRLVPNPGKEM